MNVLLFPLTWKISHKRISERRLLLKGNNDVGIVPLHQHFSRKKGMGPTESFVQTYCEKSIDRWLDTQQKHHAPLLMFLLIISVDVHSTVMFRPLRLHWIQTSLVKMSGEQQAAGKSIVGNGFFNPIKMVIFQVLLQTNVQHFVLCGLHLINLNYIQCVYRPQSTSYKKTHTHSDEKSFFFSLWLFCMYCAHVHMHINASNWW